MASLGRRSVGIPCRQPGSPHCECAPHLAPSRASGRPNGDPGRAAFRGAPARRGVRGVDLGIQEYGVSAAAPSRIDRLRRIRPRRAARSPGSVASLVPRGAPVQDLDRDVPLCAAPLRLVAPGPHLPARPSRRRSLPRRHARDGSGHCLVPVHARNRHCRHSGRPVRAPGTGGLEHRRLCPVVRLALQSGPHLSADADFVDGSPAMDRHRSGSRRFLDAAQRMGTARPPGIGLVPAQPRSGIGDYPDVLFQGFAASGPFRLRAPGRGGQPGCCGFQRGIGGLGTETGIGHVDPPAVRGLRDGGRRGDGALGAGLCRGVSG